MKKLLLSFLVVAFLVLPGCLARPTGAHRAAVDQTPVGFNRVDYSGHGFACAVEWYNDYVYVAAGAVLQVYHAPPGATPAFVREIEFRDWVREMVVSGDALFVAARGDGLFALDLADPAQPRLAGQVSGLIDPGSYTDVEAVFNDVDAKGSRVAVARANGVAQAQGGVDALVYDYDPAADSFTLVRALGSEVRSNTVWEIPISVALTDDGDGLYVGYGVLVGELVYMSLAVPGDPVLRSKLGGVMDVETKGDTAFIAVTKADWPWVPCTMLGRVRVVDGTLVDEPLVTNYGSSAGNALDIDGDLLCFGTWSPGRYEDSQYNLWAFTGLLDDTPTRVGATGTLDWIFQLACRDAPSGSDWIYVADEWGGLEMWESDGITLTLDLDRHRIATGMFALGMWNDGSRVYSVREGGGLWVFDESAPHEERVAVEWIDRSDPGCACEGCCPPAVGSRPWPPAVFVSAGDSNQGRVVLLTEDRNTAVPTAGYFMLFEEDEASGEYDCVYSDPMTVTLWSGSVVRADQEIIFASAGAHALRLYQHCPTAPDQMRFLGEIAMPSTGDGLEITDVAVYGDYLLVAEVHKALLSEPDSGAIHVYRWKQGDLTTCPAQPVLPSPTYLGSFGADLIPRRLLVDPGRNLLIVGSTSKKTFPIKEGALSFYDLGSFDPGNPVGLDPLRTLHSPPETMRVTYPSVYDVLLNGDDLYVVDVDNGLFKYSLSQGVYVGFYPAQRGTASQAYVPHMVLAPAGVVPLYLPVAVALTPSGKVVVQEHMTGRVSILVESHQVYLPLMKK